jgi:hypothetical protein
VQKE